MSFGRWSRMQGLGFVGIGIALALFNAPADAGPLYRVTAFGGSRIATDLNNRGDVLVGGVPIGVLSREDIGKCIGYVSQVPFVFSGTVAENISYGCGQCTSEQIHQAARQAQLLVLERLLNRPAELLSGQVFVGPTDDCAAMLRDYADAGFDRVFIWPIADADEQLERFMREVVPLV